MKLARKQANHISLSLPWALVGCLHLDRAGGIKAHCFTFGFLLGEDSSWIPAKRKEKIHGSLITADLPSVSTIPFDSLIFPHFLCSSFWQASCLQNLLTEFAYQSCTRTPGGGAEPPIGVFQLQHIWVISLQTRVYYGVWFIFSWWKDTAMQTLIL